MGQPIISSAERPRQEPPPIITSEQVHAVFGEIGRSKEKTEDPIGEDPALKAKKEEEIEERKNRIHLHEAVLKNLEITKAQFLIDKNGKSPSKLEAKSLLDKLKENLAVSSEAARNVDKDFLQNLSKKGEPYFHTGMKVEIKITDQGWAVFEVVVDTTTGNFMLHGETDKNGNETVAGQLANKIRLEF